MKKIFSLFITTLFCASLLAANSYWYVGDSNSWDIDNTVSMTVSADGFYEYYAASAAASSNYNCKIATVQNSWDGALGNTYTSSGFNGTNITNMNSKDNSWGTDNFRIWFDAATDFYIIVYYPNTVINNTAAPKLCASTTLPHNTFTVAGGSTTLFGTGWDPTNTDNDMELVDGLYQWKKEDVTIPAGDIIFKVCQDHAWTPIWPGTGENDNYTQNIDKGGKYDITITFNPKTGAIAVNADLQEEILVLPTIVLNGKWGAGAAWEDLELTPDEGNQTASATKSFAATALGTYEFGVKVDGNWTSNGSETTFSRSNYSVELTGYSGNMKLFVDVVEPLTFTWEYSSKTLTITYPELPAQPVICGYGTWGGKNFSTVEFTPAGDNKSASYTRTLVAGTYLFRIVKNGTKISINGTNPDDKYRCVFHRDWNAAVIGGGTNDMIIRTDIPGSYTLKWTYENDSLTIIYPELPAIKYYVAHNFASEDVVATATEMTEDAGVWSASTTISGTDAKKFKIYSVQGPYETWYGAMNAENSLAATTAEPWELTNVNGGSDINITPNGGTGNYTFSFNPENKQLNVTFPSATTTAIGNANGNDTPKKFVKDGVIYILRNGCVYDCNGRRAE